MSEQRNSIVTYAGEPERKPWLFAKGNKAALGHRNAHKFFSLRRVMREVVTDEAWREIVGVAVEQAKAGNTRAMKWISDILIGKPRAEDEEEFDITPEEAQRKIDLLFGLVTEDQADAGGDDAEGGEGDRGE